jgi:Domain of unknown function (DUF4412)
MMRLQEGIMRSIVRAVLCAAVVVSCAVPAWAADGVLIVMKVTFGSNPPQTNQVQIDQKRMRMTGTGATGSAGVMFDSNRQVMTMIDDAHKTYSEMTKADLDAFAAQMAPAMAQMQEAMKNMPPEAKARMEAMMKKNGAPGAAPGAAPKKVEYKKTGTATVGKWTCDKYEGYTNGQKTHEVCTVDPKVLGFSMADFQVMRDMQEFFKQFQQFGRGMAPQQSFIVGTPEEQGFSGIPVRSVITTSNGTQVISELAEARRQAFTDATFTVPSDYQKNDLFGRGRGR